LNMDVIGMGYAGIPCDVLLADVPGFQVTGIQRRSERSGRKIDCLNGVKSPFEGEERGLAELIEPLGYLEFLNLMANARLVLTGSGGIQEETTSWACLA